MRRSARIPLLQRMWAQARSGSVAPVMVRKRDQRFLLTRNFSYCGGMEAAGGGQRVEWEEGIIDGSRAGRCRKRTKEREAMEAQKSEDERAAATERFWRAFSHY